MSSQVYKHVSVKDVNGIAVVDFVNSQLMLLDAGRRRDRRRVERSAEGAWFHEGRPRLQQRSIRVQHDAGQARQA